MLLSATIGPLAVLNRIRLRAGPTLAVSISDRSDRRSKWTDDPPSTIHIRHLLLAAAVALGLAIRPAATAHCVVVFVVISCVNSVALCQAWRMEVCFMRKVNLDGRLRSE